MKEFVEKLIEQLKKGSFAARSADSECNYHSFINLERAIGIVNQLAEEYNNYSSDDLISKKLLIEKIWEKHKETEEMFDICVDEIKDVFCGIVAMIDELPTAYNQDSTKKNQGWIPVTERLPEESLNSVLGWDEHRKRCCFVQYYGGRWVLGNDVESVKITAWRNLPDPYKPEEKEEQVQTNFYSERFNRVQ